MIERIAALFLLVVIVAFLSFRVGRYEAYPYPLIAGTIEDIEAFLDGDSESEISVIDKIKNDTNIKPTRSIVIDPLPSKTREYHKVKLPGRNKRRDNPEVYSAYPDRKGYYLISGVFDFKDKLHGAILLSADGKVVHTWKYHDDSLLKLYRDTEDEYLQQLEVRDDANKLPHGILPMPDGSLIVATDFGIGAQRFDWCGNVDWAIPGDFHHQVEGNEDLSRAWLLQDWHHEQFKMVEIDTATGKIIRSIRLMDVMLANPGIDILGLKQHDHDAVWLFDPWHPNDIEPLPARYASAFPQFSAGDLLVSLRSLNLIFVLDPDTKKIKWWRMGLARRQHDPDWEPNGTISVLDNNMNRGISHIIRVDPQSYAAKVIFNGKKEHFYSEHQGEHSILPNGNILIASAQQGRVFEVDKEGKIVFEFLNNYSKKDNERLITTAARWIPADFFNFKEMRTCQN